MQLVLASESAYRRQLMDRLGVPYVAVAHEHDEHGAMKTGAAPEAVARSLARAKAESLAHRYGDGFILGSDQVVDVDGEILGKPGTREAALGQLVRLQGQTHRLITAVALRAPDGTVDESADIHMMEMRKLTGAELERYLDAEPALDCCGSYKIEGRGITLFAGISGADFTAIMGLPLITVVTMLRRAGFAVP